MSDALTPALALDYLRELSADIRAAIVLGAGGERLAGPEALAAPARALLEAAAGAPEIRAATSNGTVLAARDERHAVVIACGRHVLPGLARHDLRTVLAALGGRRITPAPEPAGGTLRAAAEAVLAAADALR